MESGRGPPPAREAEPTAEARQLLDDADRAWKRQVDREEAIADRRGWRARRVLGMAVLLIVVFSIVLLLFQQLGRIG